MRAFKKLTSFILAMALIFTMAPQTVLAEGDGPEPKAGKAADVTVTAITDPLDQTEIQQETGEHSVGFSFEIRLTEPLALFEVGDAFTVKTNIGQLFDADWAGDLADLQILDANGQVVALVSFTADTVTITAQEGAAGMNEMTGDVITKGVLTAKDMGATAGSPVEKTLQIGDKSVEIIFTAKQPPESGSSLGTVDVDTFWKNAGSVDNQTGGIFWMEVNPIGSLDLYGSTTYPPEKGTRMPKSYENLTLIDEIPGQGFIDRDSILICAAVPTLAMSSIDYVDPWHGPYDIPAGTYYAKREGTLRHDIKEQMTELKQYDGETRAEFEERVRSTSLSWGIYYDEAAKKEVFICNFGNVGDKANNNGLMYTMDPRGYAENYPKIFGEDGPTGGNIVSYYVEFKAYHPEVIGSKDLYNTATLTSDGGRVGGNEAKYTVNNGGGTGAARRNELIIVLLDEDTREPIKGAEFTLQYKTGNTWTDVTKVNTDENGRIVLTPLSVNDYRIVQTSFTDGYDPDSVKFTDPGNSVVNDVSAAGEFRVSGMEKFGYGTVVTNAKLKFSAEYKFESADPALTLPQEVTDLLPVDENVYVYGDTVNAIEPEETVVVTGNGVWVFEGYDRDSCTIDKDLTVPDNKIIFTGTWRYYESSCVIRPEDQTIYTGGTGVGDNASFPHPIYLAEDTEGNVSEITADGLFVNGKKAPEDLFEVDYFDKEGNQITTDEQYGDYTARITLKDGVKIGDVTTADDEVVFLGEGTLRIRYVSSYEDASEDELTGPAVYYKAGAQAEAKSDVEKAGEAGVILSEDTKICLNGNKNYEYPADTESRIALFFDTLLPAEPDGDVSAFEGQLAAHAAEKGQEMDDWQTQYRYLDLVDMNNSNAWVSSSDGSDVFWPYPEGVDKTDEMKLLHFEGLHREYRMEGEAGLDEQIAASKVSEVRIEKTDAGIWFHVPESGFSPFVLMWKDTYGVTYEFTSGTEDKDLPQSVLDLLPTDSSLYPAGETVEAINPAETKVTDGDGYWTFQGWDADEKAMEKGGITFTGTWVYTLNTYGVTYEFISGTEGKDLPQSVRDLLPTDGKLYPAGETVAAIDPSGTEVTDGDGYWTFQGWDADEKAMEKGGITFTGTWMYTLNTYGVTYEFVSGTDWMPDLPQNVLDLLPADSSLYPAGETVAAIDPAETKVTDGDGYWTFQGWDADEKAMEKGGITFTGTWVYTLNTYGVTYEFVSGTEGKDLPQSVLDLLPTDSSLYPAGETVAAINPAETKVTDGDGYWTFQGWDADEKAMEKGGITFTGTWVYTLNTPADEPSDKPSDTPDKPSVDKPADKPDQPSDVAQTGDNANPALWIAIGVAALLAVIAAAVSLYIRNRNRKHRR